MSRPDLFASGIIAVVALIVAAIDLRRRRIPNVVTAPLVVAGLSYAVLTGGASGFSVGALGALTGFAILLPLYVVGGMGAGDVKLLTGFGAWLGPVATLETIGVACLLTACFSLALRSRRSAESATGGRPSQRVHEVAASPEGRARLLPFGPMAAAGVVVSLARVH